MQSLIGQGLGDYLLETELGRGSMGVVYAAHKYQAGADNKQYAVKVLLDALANDMMFVTRFTREARIIAGLRHPNIIRVYEAGHQGPYLYFVMELFPGTPVGQILKERGRLPVGQTVEIGAQAADALDYAHREGHLVHRDIKPDNLLVDRWCRVKMLDFGLARVEGLQSITRAGTVVGSLYYVAPEQLLGRPIDSRADIYALGVSLYEMAGGQRPYRGQNLTELSRAILAGTATPLSQIEPSVSPAIEQVIARAMARDPGQRYQTAGEMRDDLRALQTAPVAPDGSPAGAHYTPPRLAGAPETTPLGGHHADGGWHPPEGAGVPKPAPQGPFRRTTLRPLDPHAWEDEPAEQQQPVRTYPPRRGG
ncbi:MAG TPA: protein kinase [Ktedonobacterales bacterium]|nr:protein kinase [Ktedonobacterales bacterium]